ncbi:MAG: hypothetical protein L0322_18650 [Chloroflexi bacterium]|nr:hypothetical protein [Chloroflexota bacterium]
MGYWRQNLPYALYCASIIIGAGVLTMPLTGRLLGFGLLLVITVLIGLWQMVIYRRMAHSTFVNAARQASEQVAALQNGPGDNPGHQVASQAWREDMTERLMLAEIQKGAALFDQIVRRTGIGWAGLVTLFLGTFLYVFIADIGYILIGSRSLNAVAAALDEQTPLLPPLLLPAGAAMLGAGLALPKFFHLATARRGAVQKILAMAGCWGIGIGALALLPDGGRENILGSLLFLIAIVAVMFVGNAAKDDGPRRAGLKAQHRVNVVVMVVELALLAVTALLVLGLFAGNGLTEPFFTVAMGAFDGTQMPHWARIIGVVLFAYVGTGIFNLASYPHLFQGNAGRHSAPRFGQVVVLGTVIPMVVYLGWTVVAALTLSPAELALGDANNQPTHILIADKAKEIGPAIAWIITLTGYLFALMAVTSACNGFTESLAGRIEIALDGSSFWQRRRFDLRPVILAAAAAVALARDIFATPIDITSILAIAGSAGGGLLIFILPLFFPYPADRRTRARYWEIAAVVVTAVILILAILYDPVNATGAAYQVLLWTKRLVAASVALMTVLLLLSEPADGSG